MVQGTRVQGSSAVWGVDVVLSQADSCDRRTLLGLTENTGPLRL